MLSKWFSGIGFLLQAVVVVAGVAVFSYFDPFDLLVSEKLTLKDTPVSVRSMREIGELITAEYYGEVIASTMEEVEIQETSMTQEFGDSLEVIHERFLDALEELQEAVAYNRVNKNRRRQLRLHYLKNHTDLISMPWYDTYINYVAQKIDQPDKNFSEKDFDKNLGTIALGNLLKNSLNKPEVFSSIEDIPLQPLSELFRTKLVVENKKKYRKRQLVLLGRGWVKAGFKFDDFTEENFRFDRESGRVIFIGMNPQILSATINPWFIPEKGVEGFEFLIVERKAKRDYEVMKRVKQLCLDKLETQAMDRDIFELATKNAQEQLKAFFELIMDQPVKQVSFYNNIFDYTLEEIKRGDGVITGQDLHLIERAFSKSDSLLQYGFVKEKEIEDFMKSVKSMPYQLFDSTEHNTISPFLTMAYELGVDGALKPLDSLKIKKYSPEAMKNRSWIKYWYDPTNPNDDIMQSDFDTAIEQLRKNIYRIDGETELILKNLPDGAEGNKPFFAELEKITNPK